MELFPLTLPERGREEYDPWPNLTVLALPVLHTEFLWMREISVRSAARSYHPVEATVTRTSERHTFAIVLPDLQGPHPEWAHHNHHTFYACYRSRQPRKIVSVKTAPRKSVPFAWRNTKLAINSPVWNAYASFTNLASWDGLSGRRNVPFISFLRSLPIAP